MLIGIDIGRNVTSLFDKHLIRDVFLKEYADKQYHPTSVKVKKGFRSTDSRVRLVFGPPRTRRSQIKDFGRK